MNDLLIPLMQEYQRLLEIDKEYQEWKKQNPDKGYWHYDGQRVSRARLERIGIMIRQTMVDYEKGESE